ncbi:hypothetical protein Pan44_47120 [Caulifigura coniformis]|uniref:Uncharacterized protein n=1 Tax=Caulifigura coniformis TaxID=2527983 RepID=A0A517SKK2_9PLAN|nr:hypothetical protein [Caulifigura coniformis]QDT56655.1 hypothetical protein Pan44_47120 [Caulifigura coniformis]
MPGLQIDGDRGFSTRDVDYNHAMLPANLEMPPVAAPDSEHRLFLTLFVSNAGGW